MIYGTTTWSNVLFVSRDCFVMSGAHGTFGDIWESSSLEDENLLWLPADFPASWKMKTCLKSTVSQSQMFTMFTAGTTPSWYWLFPLTTNYSNWQLTVPTGNSLFQLATDCFQLETHCSNLQLIVSNLQLIVPN